MKPSYLADKSLPPHMELAYSLIGTKEIVGAKDSPVIMGWAEDLGLKGIYENDEMAWCGVFFAWVMKESGSQVVLPGKDKYDYMRALKYLDMPNVIKVKPEDICVGDILIFQRPEGGHIGFCDHVSPDSYGVVGGNQSNSVSITNIAKSRLKGALRLNYVDYTPFEIVLNQSGKLSTNEA